MVVNNLFSPYPQRLNRYRKCSNSACVECYCLYDPILIHNLLSVFQRGIITPDNIEVPALTTKIVKMKTMIKNKRVQTRTVHMLEWPLGQHWHCLPWQQTKSKLRVRITLKLIHLLCSWTFDPSFHHFPLFERLLCTI